MSSENDFFDWMDGYCAAFEDLPDGAWFEACKEAVRAWNVDSG